MDHFSRLLADDTFVEPHSGGRTRKSTSSQDGSRGNLHNSNNKVEKNLRVELQTIRLNPDSQMMILNTLRFIHGPDFKLKSASSYKEQNANLGNKYWIERGNLVVRGGTDYSITTKSDIQTSESRLRQFALAKLEKYHFHSSHCAEALVNSGESVEKALEVLFNKYFVTSKPEEKPEFTPQMKEILEMRNDEKDALVSIFDNSFKVVDSNVWLVLLKLNYLAKIFEKPETVTKPKIKSSSNNFNNVKKKKEVCKLYLKGPCRFGSKCKFAHENPVEEESTNEKTVESNSERDIFELEIRFPENSLYPFEPPLIFFKSPFNTVPQIDCLRLTSRLYEEAQSLSQEGLASVFSLVDLLQNEEVITNFIKTDTRKFPEPEELLYPELVDEVSDLSKKPTHYTKRTSRDVKPNPSVEEVIKIYKEILTEHSKKQNKPNYTKMLRIRSRLPAFSKKEEILKTLNSNRVVIICGETGCGKSTQIPQYIFEEWMMTLQQCRSIMQQGDFIRPMDIVCTQPRRISAIGVAERVADERCENVGNIVGYQIRMESKVSTKTRITFCTTGILLRRLEYDPELRSVSCVIVDEVHERSEEIDFLLMVLKDLLKIRNDLNVVLMSATLNAQMFSDYFDGAPIVKIPGRTFPVKQLFLEDLYECSGYVMELNGPYCRKFKDKQRDIETEFETCDLKPESMIVPASSIPDENLSIAKVTARYTGYSRQTWKNIYLTDNEKINYELIEHTLEMIASGDHDWPKEGSILVFLPGLSEIMTLHDILLANPTFSSNGNFLVLPLHSSLSSEEQSLIFQKPSNDRRKIILSTNIAETSVTIDDCVFVIDTGKMKETRFDSNRNMECLDLVWVTRANAKQRMGRAGRVMPGVCIHLFTKHRFYGLLENPLPEIKRVPLEPLVLRTKAMQRFENCNFYDVMQDLIEPPETSSIDDALVRLMDIGALDTSSNLTPLGRHLSALPVDVRIGKLILFGAIFRCLDSALTMAACLSYKSPFVAPFGKKSEADAKKKEFACSNSDQLTALRAYRKWQQMVERSNNAAVVFCNENFMSHKTCLMLANIKYQFLGLLSSIGFVPALRNLRSSKLVRKDLVQQITGIELNCNGNNDKLLAAILCAALYPNVVKVLTPEKSFSQQQGGAVPRQPNADELRFKTKTDGYVAIHPGSVNANVGHFTSPYLVYQEKVKTSRVFIRDLSMVPHLPLVLFSGNNLMVQLCNGKFFLSLEDGWILFEAESHQVAEMLKSIREELINLLEEKINDPCLDLLHYEKGRRIIHTIVEVITKG